MSSLERFSGGVEGRGLGEEYQPRERAMDQKELRNFASTAPSEIRACKRFLCMLLR